MAAVKRKAEGGRADAAAADDAAHADKLKAEAEAEKANAAAAAAAREAKANAVVDVTDDGENHIEIKRLKKGDEETIPVNKDKVAVTYMGTFAAGTLYNGEDWSGKKFDCTLDHGPQAKKGPKKEHPLSFVLGEGKAIRGWEECVKQMSLGEKLEVTIGPKWAYRKAGLQDDNGKVLVPPNASLVFEMRLVQVRDKTVDM